MDREMKQLPLRLPIEDYEALKAYAFFTNTSMNDTVVRAVRAFLADAGRREQFEAMLTKARRDYRATLDKLAEL